MYIMVIHIIKKKKNPNASKTLIKKKKMLRFELKRKKKS